MMVVIQYNISGEFKIQSNTNKKILCFLIGETRSKGTVLCSGVAVCAQTMHKLGLSGH